jgi:hypothetical protein
MKIALFLSFLISFQLFAHEGHGNPGALPPAPNGGIAVEAVHQHGGSHNHDHSKAVEREFFVEGVYKNGSLKLFPLLLDPKGHKHFINLSTSKFEKVRFEVFDARKKVKLTLDKKSLKESWSFDVSKSRTRRFMVHFTGIFNGAKYKAKVQVERK